MNYRISFGTPWCTILKYCFKFAANVLSQNFKYAAAEYGSTGCRALKRGEGGYEIRKTFA